MMFFYIYIYIIKLKIKNKRGERIKIIFEKGRTTEAAQNLGVDFCFPCAPSPPIIPSCSLFLLQPTLFSVCLCVQQGGGIIFCTFSSSKLPTPTLLLVLYFSIRQYIHTYIHPPSLIWPSPPTKRFQLVLLLGLGLWVDIQLPPGERKGPGRTYSHSIGLPVRSLPPILLYLIAEPEITKQRLVFRVSFFFFFLNYLPYYYYYYYYEMKDIERLYFCRLVLPVFFFFLIILSMVLPNPKRPVEQERPSRPREILNSRTPISLLMFLRIDNVNCQD